MINNFQLIYDDIRRMRKIEVSYRLDRFLSLFSLFFINKHIYFLIPLKKYKKTFKKQIKKIQVKK